MPRLLTIPLVLAALAFPGPAVADLAEDYLTACLRATGNNERLCACKAEQATKLDDEEMLGYLVAQLANTAQFNEAVKAGEVPEDIVERWPYYVRDTASVCALPQAG